MHRVFVLLISCLLLPILAAGQAPMRIAIRAGKLIDGRSEKPLENPLIQVVGDKIVSVTADGTVPAGVEVVDLGNATDFTVRKMASPVELSSFSRRWTVRSAGGIPS